MENKPSPDALWDELTQAIFRKRIDYRIDNREVPPLIIYLSFSGKQSLFSSEKFRSRVSLERVPKIMGYTWYMRPEQKEPFIVTEQ